MDSNLPNLRNRFTDIFENFFNDFNRASLFERWPGTTIPRLNISETDNTYHIEAELPGVKPNEVELKLDNNILTIKGNIEERSEEKKKNYHMRELYYGNFQRSITLPGIVNENDINAVYKDGILKIDILKKEKGSTKRIEIREE